jgi:hypothetical protein
LALSDVLIAHYTMHSLGRGYLKSPPTRRTPGWWPHARPRYTLVLVPGDGTPIEFPLGGSNIMKAQRSTNGS